MMLMIMMVMMMMAGDDTNGGERGKRKTKIDYTLVLFFLILCFNNPSLLARIKTKVDVMRNFEGSWKNMQLSIDSTILQAYGRG